MAGVGGRQLRIAGVSRKIDDRLRTQSAVEMFMQQDFRRLPDIFGREFHGSIVRVYRPGIRSRIVPSRLLSRNIWPPGPSAKRRSARVAAGLPCAAFFSLMTCRNVFDIPLSFNKI